MQDNVIAKRPLEQLEVLTLGGQAEGMRLIHLHTVIQTPSNRWDAILAAVISDRTWARFSMSLGASGLRWIGKLNVPLYRATGGRLMGNVGKAPVLLLTTTGRRSGQKRTAPVLYLADAQQLIVIGSNAGNTQPGLVTQPAGKPRGRG